MIGSPFGLHCSVNKRLNHTFLAACAGTLGEFLMALRRDIDLEHEHRGLAALVADERYRTFDTWSMTRHIFASNIDTVMIPMDNEAKNRLSNVRLERAQGSREEAGAKEKRLSASCSHMNALAFHSGCRVMN
jgi:hypothetical protein